MDIKEKRTSEIIGVLLFALAILVFVSLITYHFGDVPHESDSPNRPPGNWVGIVGAYLAYGIFFALGRIISFVVPLAIAFWGIVKCRDIRTGKWPLRIVGIVLLLLSLCSLLGLSFKEYIGNFPAGGYIGHFLPQPLSVFGRIGAYLITATLLIISLPLAIEISYLAFFSMVGRGILSFFRGFRKIFVRRPRQPKESVSRPPEVKEKKIVALPPAKLKKITRKEPAPAKNDAYTQPDFSLLTQPKIEEVKEDLQAKSTLLEETLSEFGISAKVVGAVQGPVITRFEIQPAKGVTVSSVTSRSNDIALKLAASSVRMEAPIPGKAAVGIEVPNRNPSFVYLSELLDTKEFYESSSKLTLALGKDIAGKPVVADLASMPHLLIAGTTGSGKSVCINCVINSILFQASPDEVKFLLIDPKRVELKIYNDLPHIITPVITDPKQATQALKWMVREVERRFKLFAQCQARDIESYNARTEEEKVPYIIVIIDELADLMLVAPVDCEHTITRLAQLARAVGIHIVLATQRPSVDVLTGVIKANFPVRIAFQVASRVDSRIVLDMSGAEKLLGKGDMLFSEPSRPKPRRIQGSHITDSEIEKVARFIRSQREPVYIEDIFTKESSLSSGTSEDDELYQEAASIVVQAGRASVSMLQRRLKVGYARAARLVDMMEEKGLVGPYRGSKVREVLVGEDYLEKE
jgi:S-DNA-T family DNA segregation ATPase FtsK/SpoIIIE